MPIEPSTGDYASTTDQDTWRSFETALESIEATSADGIGFVFTDHDPIVGVDLDDCRDPDTRVIDEWARDVITTLDSYTEVSPSGTGVHIIVDGELPEGRSRSGDIEMYETSRFFTVTGDHLDQTPRTVRKRGDELREVHEDHLQTSTENSSRDERDRAKSNDDDIDLTDEEIIERARDAANGDRFDSLWRGQTAGYDSHSEADMALCLHLAFWTGGDAVRMDRLFRKSGLMRPKWDDVHYADGATYGERTIERALETVDEIYDPDRDPADRSHILLSETSGESGSHPEGPAASANRDGESVYLEERNRLLQQKVQSQQATIERQAGRISELESEIQTIRDDLAAAKQPDSEEIEHSSRIKRVTQWLTES